MRSDITKLFLEQYHPQNNNCAHFVCKAWEYLTGQSLQQALQSLLLPERRINPDLRHHFVKLTVCKNPCLILMHGSGTPPHIGVWVEDKVLHLQNHRVEYVDLSLATFGFQKQEFYLPC